ncbi:hypothetical protein VEx25_A0070, partial [Vibrio antiquarius]
MIAYLLVTFAFFTIKVCPYTLT